METSPAPWIEALRHSPDRLRAVAGPLGLSQLQRPSYAAKWSIAQVLYHRRLLLVHRATRPPGEPVDDHDTAEGPAASCPGDVNYPP